MSKRNLTHPTKPTRTVEPHVYLLKIRGTPVLAIAAKGKGEATDYVRGNKLVELERATAVQAAVIGSRGIPIEYVKQDYVDTGLAFQPGLLIDMAQAQTDGQAQEA